MTAPRKAALDVRRLLQAHYWSLEPYAPIEPLEVLSQRLGIPADRIVKLDGNENPYGPSPRVREALARFDAYHIYPDPFQRELRRAIAGYVGVEEDRIVVGNGSDEIIDLLLRLFVGPGDRVISCPPTFGMYSFNTAVCGGTLVEAPRREDFTVDVAKVREAAGPRAKVLFLASPNNPTGNATPAEDILALLETGILVVVDEAYYEFCGQTVAPLVSRHDNLVVLRTFSKWAGLAGLRVGYGVLPAWLAELLDRAKPPYNVNVAAQLAAKVSLEDLAYLQRRTGAILEERTRLFHLLEGIPFLRPYPSQANFILCTVIGRHARALKEGLEARGTFVKHYDGPHLSNALRISIGTPEQSDLLIAALRELGDKAGGR